MKFNHLTVVSTFIESGKKYAKCQCDCGDECVKRLDGVKSGKFKSCGNCIRLNKRVRNLIGQKFGELEVVSYCGLTKHRGAQFLCKCSCGREAIIPSIRLVNGDNKTCGKCTNCRYEEKEDYIIGRNYKTNFEFYIDNEDINKINRYSWSKDHYGYVVSCTGGENIKMQRLIMNAEKGVEVDHINIDHKNDNRKSNLRLATHQQNIFNHAVIKKSKTGYKGVREIGEKYCAIIQYNGKVYYLGIFTSAEDAAIRYNEKAKELFGEFAWLNDVALI